ncbi:hypothetical protein MMC11_008814 [Xylographa trunciseda]|nr:hypothetical protein [Xylographa trunciseda]
MLGPTSGNPVSARPTQAAASIYGRRPHSSPANPSILTQPSSTSSYTSRSSGTLGSVDVSAASNAAAHGGDSLTHISRKSDHIRGDFKAEKWFDDSNQNVLRNRNVTFEDCDPPFYLRNEPSSSTEDVSRAALPPARLQDNTLQDSRQPLLSRMDSLGSTSEDYRGVIDDLTVENQNLKERLKAYERSYSSGVLQEKLFEVRVHGLPPSKKRKLVETLRDFVSQLDKSPGHQPQDPVALQPTAVRHLPLGKGTKLSSSTTSNNRPPDSGYASMSTPRDASNLQSNHLEALKPSQPVLSNRQNIKSYLQDIPGNLLPKPPQQMTERSRKKLVVRRLEELFTGKGATVENHSQSRQQEEVSQSAARADRRAVGASGQIVGIEGHREAKMQAQDTEDLNDSAGDDRPSALHRSSSDGEESARGGMSWSSEVTPDQRPTRPLDLDPSRAQIPSENIDYIRHLCIIPPDLDLDSRLGDGSRWVYLNLLFGMAQLHTVNVTLEFVRKAVAEVSDKFELSSDGSKIRWRGGCEGTKMSSDGNSSFEQEDESSMDDLHAASKHRSRSRRSKSEKHSGSSRSLRSVFDASPAASGLAKVERPVLPHCMRPGRKFGYQPLFRHHITPQDEDSAMTGHNSPHSSGHAQDNAAGAARKVEDGPIIFYDGPGFCTDFSRETSKVPYHGPEYDKPMCSVLGCSAEDDPVLADLTESKGPLNMSNHGIIDDWLEDDQLENFETLNFEALSAAGSDDVYAGFAPIMLEASGVGGVRPSDNFAVDVNIRYTRILMTATEDPHHPSCVPTKQCLSVQNPSIVKGGSFPPNLKPSSTHRIRSEIVSSLRTALSPSSLPPPSYAFLPVSSSNSEDCDEDSLSPSDDCHRSSSMSLVNAEVFAPPRFLYSVSSESTRESTDFSSDDSSIDMLAHARKFDPDSVAAQEREFDKNRVLSILEDLSAGNARDYRQDTSSIDDDDDSPPTSDRESRDYLPALKRRHDVDLHLNDTVKRLRVH